MFECDSVIQNNINEKHEVFLQTYTDTQWTNFLNTVIDPLTPNDPYSGRTAPLASKRFILYIYSTNSGTEYFKHGIYSPFFLFKMQFVS